MKMDRFDEIVGRGARAEGFAALDEGARVEVIRQAGMVPPVCGDDIPCAPARGPVRAVDFMAAYPDGQDAYVFKPAGFLGRKTMVRADVFDTMAAQAARKGRAFGLTVSQVAMGRTYRALVERHSAGATRCSSVEAMPSGGRGDSDGFTEARLAASRRIDLLQARVGAGSAMAVRRIRPSVRGSRASIPDRALVDRVCLADEDISAVLRAYGWSVYGDTVQALTAALSAALERMAGPAVRRDIQVIHL
ncbi:hypothetical protein [Pseudotabrizicola sp. 4114]|uniref:hypothetical protein n=1 Tax=Pseudotabrizicola sp. 4114 TaxID=2817731 RepID=UPI002856832B|nr:hypothetical protein [Pseudorhodobacter sp. 4114]